MLVFVPDSWEGIKDVQPLKINFKPDMPDRIKPKTRYIPDCMRPRRKSSRGCAATSMKRADRHGHRA
jgi:hypothetical protein